MVGKPMEHTRLSDEGIIAELDEAILNPDLNPDLDGQSDDLPFEEKLTKPFPRWLLIFLASSGLLGAIAGLALLWLLSLPPVPDCQKLSPLSPDMERLYCAQEAARRGELPEILAGLDLVDDWTVDHPLYREAQKWMLEWSEAVLTLSRTRMAEGNYDAAVNLINQIPPSSPLYPEAQAERKQWNQEWQRGADLYNAAQKAMAARQWDQVSAHIMKLSELDYDHWRFTKTADLSQQLIAERWAWESLKQGQRIAQAGTPEKLGEAIALLSRLDRQTHVWKTAQQSMNRWSDTLLKVGLQQWQARQLDRSMAIARQVALNPDYADEANDLLKLSQARKLALSSGTTWHATPQHIFNLMEAVAAARQIQPGSRFYPQAKWFAESWNAQLQDVKQVQVAQLTATLGQPAALQAAIAQSQQVALTRPRRVQAQTMAAHWGREIQRVQDRAYLTAGRKLAEQNTIPALKSAIAEVNFITPDRPFRAEAQSLIYLWSNQIEALEDQPTLDRARALARDGQWGQAIWVASQIRRGRALYNESRAAIGEWQDHLRRLEIARSRRLRELARQSAPGTERRTTSSRDSFRSLPDWSEERSQTLTHRDESHPRPKRKRAASPHPSDPARHSERTDRSSPRPPSPRPADEQPGSRPADKPVSATPPVPPTVPSPIAPPEVMRDRLETDVEPFDPLQESTIQELTRSESPRVDRTPRPTSRQEGPVPTSEPSAAPPSPAEEPAPRREVPRAVEAPVAPRDSQPRRESPRSERQESASEARPSRQNVPAAEAPRPVQAAPEAAAVEEPIETIKSVDDMEQTGKH